MLPLDVMIGPALIIAVCQLFLIMHLPPSSSSLKHTPPRSPLPPSHTLPTSPCSSLTHTSITLHSEIFFPLISVPALWYRLKPFDICSSFLTSVSVPWYQCQSLKICPSNVSMPDMRSLRCLNEPFLHGYI